MQEVVLEGGRAGPRRGAGLDARGVNGVEGEVPAAEWDTGKFQKLSVEKELHAQGINVVAELQQLQRNFEDLDVQAECVERAIKDSLTDEEVDRRVRAFLRSAGTRTFTVLEIRRELKDEICPRQLNRVLYAGVQRDATRTSGSELSECFIMLPAEGRSAKPRWRLGT